MHLRAGLPFGGPVSHCGAGAHRAVCFVDFLLNNQPPAALIPYARETQLSTSIVPAWPASAAALVFGWLMVVQPAAAQTYPWCANFADGAGVNCGFSTESQCRITIAGSGGFCGENNLYRPAAAMPERPRRSRLLRHPS
jgi:hypothetical protein